MKLLATTKQVFPRSPPYKCAFLKNDNFSEIFLNWSWSRHYSFGRKQYYLSETQAIYSICMAWYAVCALYSSLSAVRNYYAGTKCVQEIASEWRHASFICSIWFYIICYMVLENLVSSQYIYTRTHDCINYALLRATSRQLITVQTFFFYFWCTFF